MASSAVTFCFIALMSGALPEILDPVKPNETDRKSKVLLPKLENLYYIDSESIPVQNLVRMIKHRWNGYDILMDPGSLTHNHTHGGWVKIRSLYLGISKEPMEEIIDQIQAEIGEGLKVYHSVPSFMGGDCDAIMGREWALYQKLD